MVAFSGTRRRGAAARPARAAGTWPPIVLALAACALCLLTACPAEEGAGTPTPGTRATPGVSHATPDPRSVGGGIGEGTSLVHPVRLTVWPEALILNAPPATDAPRSAGFNSQGAFQAVVLMSDGSTTSDVVWASEPGTPVTVDANGRVVIRPGATWSAPITVTLAAARDASVTAQCFVTLRADGVLGVTIQ